MLLFTTFMKQRTFANLVWMLEKYKECGFSNPKTVIIDSFKNLEEVFEQKLGVPKERI